jgi:arylsulfatase A-like enzyme/Tfp pilus assembly protein PilF
VKSRLVSIGLLAIAAAACRHDPGTVLQSAQARGANVLLVTIDTLRRDRVGAYGNRDGLTPTIDRIAAHGIVYRHAYAHAPMTLPSHTSILTGLTPRHHGVRNNTAFRLDDRVPTLATLLKGTGYRTGAFIGAFVLDARFGLSRGFDEYDDRLPHADRTTFHFSERRAAEVVQKAGDWILQAQGGSAPWFAWVHLYDPHAPYDPPAEYRVGHAPYDGEVAYADAMLGRLLDRLRTAGQLDRTVIVVTADHGESLGEHGEATHGLFAYEATIAVPLVISGPSIAAESDRAWVAHADIVPTVLDLVGTSIPPGLDGQSLVHPPSDDRGLYIEALDASLTRGWAPLTGIVARGWKYIDLPEPELYDLAADPSEHDNRAGHDPREAVLQRTLAAVMATAGPRSSAAALDPDAAARLRSLGYTAGSAPRSAPPTVRDDPKRLVALNERFNTALTAFDEGRADEALAGFNAVLRERPDFLSARTSAATLLLARGRASDAVQLLRAAPQPQQTAPELLVKLGAALRDSGDLRGAAATFERAQAAGDARPDLLENLAVVYAQLGRSADAARLFDEILSRNAPAATTLFNVGLFELHNGHADRAAAALRRAVARESSYGDAWQALGAALATTDRPGAIDAWRHAERLRPHDFDLLFDLGMLLADSPSPAEALPYLQRFVQQAPRDRYAADLPRVTATIARIERRPS